MSKRGSKIEQKQIAPLVAWAERTKGGKAELAVAMTKAMKGDGTAVHRNEVTQWLNPDPARRLSPAFGTGLVLLRVGRRMAKLKPAVIAFALMLGTNAFGLTASWYGGECRGLKMANGRPFDPDALTCASWDYPLGTRLLVTSGRREVIVTVTDRGPARRLVAAGRRIDLSRAAMTRLGGIHAGVIPVKIGGGK